MTKNILPAIAAALITAAQAQADHQSACTAAERSFMERLVGVAKSVKGDLALFRIFLMANRIDEIPDKCQQLNSVADLHDSSKSVRSRIPEKCQLAYVAHLETSDPGGLDSLNQLIEIPMMQLPESLKAECAFAGFK